MSLTMMDFPKTTGIIGLVSVKLSILKVLLVPMTTCVKSCYLGVQYMLVTKQIIPSEKQDSIGF